jgi:hypothetical protein
MKRILIALLALILLSGCSASWHVKRATRLDPTIFSLDSIVKIDTFIYEIPKVHETVRYDTLIEIQAVDPITLKEYIIKYEIRNDTIKIECPDTEVIFKEKIVKETIVLKPTFMQKIQWLLYAIGLGFLVIVTYKLLR